jgi:GNAT superfamily N-acetyltransferase
MDEEQHGLLAFRPVTQYKPGILASFLHQCYTKLLSNEPLYWQPEEEKWLRFDQDVFNNPKTIGRCVFITCLGEEEIGFASFDPRRGPEFGLIGHNCVLPCFQKDGRGKRQVLEILERFRQRGIKRARVVTSDHSFFLPARKMYLGCGFHETRRLIGGPDPRYELVEYEISL